MFASVDDVILRLGAQRYIANRTIATVVYLADHLRKPILVEGPAGVGKTELAKVLAGALGQPLLRLQCYEGLDEAKALYEWEYAKQLLYTQILKEKIGEVVADAPTLGEAVDRIGREDDVFFSERFLLPRPLLRAITDDHPNVLLIDEIDKADSTAFRTTTLTANPNVLYAGLSAVGIRSPVRPQGRRPTHAGRSAPDRSFTGRPGRAGRELGQVRGRRDTGKGFPGPLGNGRLRGGGTRG